MSDDEEIALPSDTLAILQSFMAEKEESERKFAELQRKAEQDFDLRVEIDAFEEDYQMSQFWVNFMEMKLEAAVFRRSLV